MTDVLAIEGSGTTVISVDGSAAIVALDGVGISVVTVDTPTQIVTVGEVGPPGIQGPAGSGGGGGSSTPGGFAFDGEDGQDGMPIPGASGAAGASGTNGFSIPGMDGSDGEDGMPIPGTPGAAGTPGSTGANGNAGFSLDGEDGADGMPIPGPQGVAGVGTPGPQGAVAIGIMFDGQDGEDGIVRPGAPGTNGTNGATGPAGLPVFLMDGEDGQDGMMIPGPAGAQGPQGTAGTGGGASGGGGMSFDGQDGDDGMPIGLGMKDTLNVYQKAQVITPVVVASATGTYTPDASYCNFQLTLTGNLTLANPTNLQKGQVFNFCLDQDATGGRTITLGSMWNFGGTPNWLTTGSAQNFFSGYYDGTTIRCGGPGTGLIGAQGAAGIPFAFDGEDGLEGMMARPSVLPVEAGGTGDAGSAWVAMAGLTVSAQTGTLTSASATGRWRSIGKTVFFSLSVGVATNGTGATHIVVSGLPFTTAAVVQVVAGRETSTTGKLLCGYIAAGASAITIANYDDTYPAANGYVMALSGVVEAA